MSAPSLRRGGCPTLAAPVLTGDGWLARLTPAAGLTPAQLGGLAHAAARHGNGRIEVTARGSLQVRGLTESSAVGLGAEVAGFGIVSLTGVSVLTGALAGLDASEIADPGPMAGRIRDDAAALGGRLGPKVSVIVDGGGAVHLDDLGADIRLRAVGPRWLVTIGGRARGLCDSGEAVRLAIAVLGQLAALGAAARARDLPGEGPAEVTVPDRAPAVPIGGFALADGTRARGFGLPFGQIESDALAAFAAAAGTARDLRPAPGRALLAVGLAPRDEEDLTRQARLLGFVVDPDDARLSVVACSGAPACRSAHLATRALAEDLARERPDLLASGVRLHLSGCAKRCAQPMGPAVTLVATPGGCQITADEGAVPADLRDFLMQRVAEAAAAV